MTIDEISEVLRNISNLLQIQGEDSFRARVYERSAESIESLAGDLHQLVEDERLRSIPGIGKAIEQKIIEMLETGRCRFYDSLIQEMGSEVLDLLRVRGVGTKTACRFYQELEVKSPSDLRKALDSGRLHEMKRMGAKTIAAIDEGLQFLESQRQKRPLWQILSIAHVVLDALEHCDEIKRIEFTGGFRRREEVLHSLELIVECESPAAIAEILSGIDGVKSSEMENDALVVASVDAGFPLRIYCFESETYEEGLLMTTGVDAHIAKLNQIAITRNLDELRTPLPVWCENKTESDIYNQLGLPFIAPELRGTADAIEAALTGNLPILIEPRDLRCDLHTHTDWSDGRHSIREMIEAAKAFGHEYIAITDHSESSRVANGLTPERLLEQIKHIREINVEIDNIEVLAGSEVDIRIDGNLDFSDEILEQLDIVIASVHTGFTLSEAEMTARVIRAIENPFVTIIGHPTGRLLGRRPGYAIDLDAVISAAAAHDVVLEINASPSRLDLEPSVVRHARQNGVLLAINTDAHATKQVEHITFGVNVARRGWLEKEDVINTYPLEALKQIIS